MNSKKVLTPLCYILIPIFTIILCVAVSYESYVAYIQQDNMNDETVRNENFIYYYINNVSNYAKRLIYNNSLYNQITDGENIIFYFKDDEKIKNLSVLIGYGNKYITNVEATESTDTVQEINDFIDKQNRKHTKIENGVITSSTENMSKILYNYFDRFNFDYYTTNNQIQQDISTQINDFYIYSSYDEEILIPYKEEINNFVNALKPYNNAMYVLIPVSSVGIILCFIYLCFTIGKDKELSGFNNFFYEIILFIDIMIIGIALSGIVAILEMYMRSGIPEFSLVLSIMVTCFLIAYIAFMLLLYTTVKRIKAKKFWDTTIIGKSIKWICKVIKRTWKKFTNSMNRFEANLKISTKILLYIISFALLAILLPLMFSFVGILLDIILIILAYNHLMNYVKSYKIIENKLKDMYEGNNGTAIDESNLKEEFKNSAKYITDISSGLNNAIQESIKSERLKTELITNVSHDIKTPLTSIINYVDLLKQENIDNKKIEEYIQILDSKSQRLKKLTEDLVEASKASSGAIKLHLEKININELIKQSIGEFEDRFNSKGLIIDTSYTNNDITITADNRYLYRVIENLFSNISKYALENSRVYIEVLEKNNKLIISMKNVSKEKLNISSDELMQRFVRGDKSRNTEGSGLGLSIAKSLTELQNGKFKINIDGDLFKVQIEFPI